MINKIFEKPSFSLFNNYEFIDKLRRKVNDIIDVVNNGSGGSGGSSYTFEFDITIEGGLPVATAREGVTYETITNALEETSSVYFKGYLPDGTVLMFTVTRIASSGITATGILLETSNPITFSGIYIDISNEDSVTVGFTNL